MQEKNTSRQTAWKNKNLQLYFCGQIVSLVGTWMQQMALSWLVYRLTNSPLMLGVIGFTSQLPSLVLTPVAGIIVDRSNRHRLLLVTQALAMVQAGVLAAIVWSGHPQLWQLVMLSALLGMVTSFELPTRMSFLVDMLDNNDQLASAIAINSSINTLTRLIGPFVAGLCVACMGEGICFLANAISYLAVIVALLLVKSNQKKKSSPPGSAVAQLKEGFTYTFGFRPIRDLIFLVSLIGLFAMPFGILMPAFAKDVFHSNASTLGFLTGASGAGSMVAAMFLTSRKDMQGLSRWIISGCAICGLALIVFGFSNILLLSLLAVAAIGFGSMIALAGSNTVIQTVVDEDKRGRVMSFVVMAFLGLAPFGCMAGGALANVIGVGSTVVVEGIFTLVLAVVFAKRIARIQLTKVAPAIVEREISDADAELTAVNA